MVNFQATLSRASVINPQHCGSVVTPHPVVAANCDIFAT
jgi:hypothetical protein